MPEYPHYDWALTVKHLPKRNPERPATMGRTDALLEMLWKVHGRPRHDLMTPQKMRQITGGIYE